MAAEYSCECCCNALKCAIITNPDAIPEQRKKELLKIENARHRNKDQIPKDLDPDLLHQHVNPLLAAWGKQGRDYIGMLYGYDQPDEYRESFAEIDMFNIELSCFNF